MLATLARSALSLVVVACAALVALCVLILRALDAAGFERAGAMLSAMGARRPARRARVEVQRVPVNRRRARVLAWGRHVAGLDADSADAECGVRECPECDGTGEGSYGRGCGRCHGRGEIKVRTEADLDAEEVRGWAFVVAG